MTDSGAPWESPLMAQLAAGDHDAFADLYLATSGAVWARARRAVGPAEADDAVSVVFLEIWRCRHKAVAVEGSLLPWVLAVADRCFASYRRTRRRHEQRLSRFASHTLTSSASRSETASHDHAEQVVASVYAQEATLIFLRAIDGLPDPQGYIARRCLMDGATSLEVAAELGSNASTVRGQLTRARTALRSLLSQTGDRSDSAVGASHLPGGGRAASPGARLMEGHL